MKPTDGPGGKKPFNTCFDFVPVPESHGECAAIAAELESRLAALLPEVRFTEMRGKIANWDVLPAAERDEFAAAMGWRRAIFLDDDWFWGQLDFEGSLPVQPTRTQFRQWAAGQLAALHKLAAQQKFPDKGKVIDEADRALARDFARNALAGQRANREYVNWRVDDPKVDNQEFIMPLRLTPHLRLAEGFSVSHDGRYLTAMIQLLADMLWVIPGNVILSPDGKNPRTHWGLDALHVAIRTQNLVAMFAFTAEAVDVDATTLMWKMLYLCGARCQEFWHTKPHNIIFYEPAGLGMAGFYFPAFKSAQLWRESAQQRLIGALRGSIMPDGSNVEGAFGYHAAYLDSPQQILDAAEYSGLPLNAAFVETFRQRRRAILEFWAKIATPSRTLPPLGDASAYDLRELLARFGKLYSSDLAQGVAAVDEPARWPRERSFYLPVQRYAVMRSGWDKDALWCGFNLRGFHFGHDHYDLFHVALHAGSERLLIDTGCLDYDANRERSRASASHNTLVVDGQDNRAGAAADIRWHSTDAFDWSEGLSLGSPTVRHRRAVCFLKPDVFVILDRVDVTDNIAHQYDFYFHLPPGSDVQRAGFDFVADDQWTALQDEGLVTPWAFATPSRAPILRFSSKRAGGFSAVTVFRGTAVRLPVFVYNAANGEPVPAGRAMAVQLGDAHILWSDPGYGEKFAGDWTTDGELLVARGASASARGASVVSHQGLPAGWEDLKPG